MSKAILVQNIAGGLSRSNLVKVGMGESVNMYPETQDITDKSTTLLMRSAEGARKFVNSAFEGQCRGLFRVSRGINGNPTLYAVFGSKLYLVTADGIPFAIGDIGSTLGAVSMAETNGYGSAAPHLVLVDGLRCYAVDVTMTVADQRTDFRAIELPNRVNDTTSKIEPTHVCYAFNYLVCNDKAADKIYFSKLYPFETTTSTNETDYDIWRVNDTEGGIGLWEFCDWAPDNTLAIISTHSKIYSFGQLSWQAFSFNDDENNPFSCPDNAAGSIGIRAVNSLAKIADKVLWLGTSEIGDNAIFMIEGLEVRRVSTPDLERELAIIKNPENATAQIWQEHQHTFYAITFQDSDKTYVYDAGEDAWHERASYDIKNRLRCWRYTDATYAYNRTIVACGTELCQLDENVYEEHDGRPILKLRRGGVLTSNDQPFYLDSAELICNQGQHGYPTRPGDYLSNTFLEANPRISVRYSWDGATWSDYEDYYLGKTGEYEWTTVMWSLGLGRFFTLEVSTTEKIPFSIENLKVQFTQCGNFV